MKSEYEKAREAEEERKVKRIMKFAIEVQMGMQVEEGLLDYVYQYWKKTNGKGYPE